ncbi:MAG: AAA family ATPase [Pseudomonadota bacterium]
MTILQDIQKWSEGQPAWQQDAIARIYGQAELSAHDYDDMLALLKAEHGIPDPAGRKPQKLAADQIAGAAPPGQKIQLLAIKNLRNVNALAPDQRLSIAQAGLSVIYGENGAGKSGYSRALKKACRARDQSEPIHPDARLAPGQAGAAQARFELLVDDQPIEVEWIANQAAPEPLSAIAIFDSHCARAYVDNKGDFAYIPYGLDILAKLAAVSAKLKAMASAELASVKPNIELFSGLSRTQTKVGVLLRGISPKTKPGDVEALATLTDAGRERHDVLAKALAERDPKQKAIDLRAKAARYADLASRVTSALSHVSDAKFGNLRELVAASIVAKQAAELASKAFKETAGLLAGTGGEPWKALYEAARLFAAESHPGKEFPHLGPESECPLCQNVLGERGIERLAAFDKFVQQEAEKAEKAARAAAVTAFNELRGAALDLLLDAGLTADLEASDTALLANCQALQKSLIARKDGAVKACAPGGDWSAVIGLTDDPQARLIELSGKLKDEAKALDERNSEKARAAMVTEHAELDASIRLSELKEAALDAIQRLVLASKLEACVSQANSTTGISRKSTELSNSVATHEVVAALNRELVVLNVHELKAAMKAESQRGKTQYKLVLETPGNIAAKDVLSEGEQRAIAIAAFLAEVNLGGGLGGVVFDDPVSSLDHRRRWHVAKRLAEEASKRQVIVFTHDIYFLCILQQCAEEIGLDLAPQCIRKAPTGFGVHSDRVPFDAMPTTKRVGALRDMHSRVAAANKAGDDEKHTMLTRDAYFHLRLAWERAVEEVLFHGVVTRFGEGVSTQRLNSVIVEDDDFKKIEVGMTRCSKFAHDPALGAHLPTPSPDELMADIQTLETWRGIVEKRKDGIRKRRE